MKGRSLREIAEELDRIQETKKDYKVSTSAIHMDHRGDLELVGHNKFLKPTSWAHQQISSYLDIPKAYYDRMLESDKNLLAENVNHWFHVNGQEGDKRMLRTVDGKLRGFLSPRYARLDSYDLLNAIYPILKDKAFQIVSAEHTEKRLYIKATLPKMQSVIKKDDVVQHGVIISTSDVGAGSLRIEPYSLRLVCTNGLISESAIKKYHVGREVGGDSIMEVLSDQAMEADNQAFWLKIRDVLLHSISPEVLKKETQRFVEAAERKIENFDLMEVVELACKKTSITSKLIKEDIVKQLASGNEGAGLTQWGLVNSFTAVAKKPEIDYDLATDLERAGGTIVRLNNSEWRTIAA